MRPPGSGDNRDGSSVVRGRVPYLTIVMAVGVAAVFADLALHGPLFRADEFSASLWEFRGPYDYPIADQIDRIGTRMVCLPILFAVAYLLSRRLRSIRPLVIAFAGTLGLNFVVGVVKLASGRESPRTGGPELFTGSNVLFPSGHTANVIFVYGLAAALLIRYGHVRPNFRRLLILGVGAIFVLMTVVSVYRHTHWVSDLIAGGMVGAAALQVCLLADREWNSLRSTVKRIVGPAWVHVEWLVRRLRPVVIRRPPDDPPGSGRVSGRTGSPGSAGSADSTDSGDGADRELPGVALPPALATRHEPDPLTRQTKRIDVRRGQSPDREPSARS